MNIGIYGIPFTAIITFLKPIYSFVSSIIKPKYGLVKKIFWGILLLQVYFFWEFVIHVDCCQAFLTWYVGNTLCTQEGGQND